jgi:ABC-type uncharacterized transport system permease subunit
LIDALFAGAVAAYGLASALLLAYLVGAGRRSTAGALPIVWFAAAMHVAHDALRWGSMHVGPFSGVGAALSTLSLLVVVAFVALRGRRPRLDVVGAFVTPLALLMLLGSRLPAHDVPGGGALLAVHIAANLIAVAAFTVACGLAVAYLLQERQVKSRQLGGLFHRLPPLEMLDQLAYRCIVVGLPALTVGVATGLVVGSRGARVEGLQWQQYFAMLSWMLFASVLLLRVAAGWRGRRAAIGTILGYASAVIVLLFYSVRGRGA